MSIRILEITNRVPYPLADGGALAMDAMLRGYAEAGAQVYLLSMNTSRHPVQEAVLTDLYQSLAGFYTVSIDNSLKIKGLLRNLLFSNKPEHADRFRSQAFAGRLRELLISIDPQVVQLESPFLASYIPLIRQTVPRALLVYRMHNVEAQIWERLSSQCTGLKRYYLTNLASRMARYEQDLWKSVDLILPITATDAERIAESGIKTAVQVAPFGIRPPKSSGKLPPGPFKVYHIGAMDWLPNQEAIKWFLREIWPEVVELSPELTFHFAGRNMPAFFYDNLPEGAYCHGEVADAQEFTRDKHILVIPLFSGGGIRVKALEAMAAGKLVISTRIGMQGIDVQPELHYLAADNAAQFVHLIGWAESHREKVEGFADVARMLIVERYDDRQIISNVLQRFQGMLS